METTRTDGMFRQGTTFIGIEERIKLEQMSTILFTYPKQNILRGWLFYR